MTQQPHLVLLGLLAQQQGLGVADQVTVAAGVAAGLGPPDPGRPGSARLVGPVVRSWMAVAGSVGRGPAFNGLGGVKAPASPGASFAGHMPGGANERWEEPLCQAPCQPPAQTTGVGHGRGHTGGPYRL